MTAPGRPIVLITQDRDVLAALPWITSEVAVAHDYAGAQTLLGEYNDPILAVGPDYLFLRLDEPSYLLCTSAQIERLDWSAMDEAGIRAVIELPNTEAVLTEPPALGARVLPRPGLTRRGVPVPQGPWTVVNVMDHRPELGCLVVAQETVIHDYLTQDGYNLQATAGVVFELAEINPCDTPVEPSGRGGCPNCGGYNPSTCIICKGRPT